MQDEPKATIIFISGNNRDAAAALAVTVEKKLGKKINIVCENNVHTARSKLASSTYEISILHTDLSRGTNLMSVSDAQVLVLQLESDEFFSTNELRQMAGRSSRRFGRIAAEVFVSVPGDERTPNQLEQMFQDVQDRKTVSTDISKVTALLYKHHSTLVKQWR